MHKNFIKFLFQDKKWQRLQYCNFHQYQHIFAVARWNHPYDSVFCMMLFDSIWICMTKHYYLLLCMIFYGYVLLCMAILDYVWLYYDYIMTLYYSLWLWMTMYVFVWLWICTTVYEYSGLYYDSKWLSRTLSE